MDKPNTLILGPQYPREQPEANTADVSLSFLTAGLNKLGLESAGKFITIALNLLISLCFL